MKDLQAALNEVPIAVLENIVIGGGDDGITIGCTNNDDETGSAWEELVEEHPQLKIIADYFGNIVLAVQNEEFSEIVNSESVE